jgi:hypothetical protein
MPALTRLHEIFRLRSLGFAVCLITARDFVQVAD